jgi:hypothetical protein
VHRLIPRGTSTHLIHSLIVHPTCPRHSLPSSPLTGCGSHLRRSPQSRTSAPIHPALADQVVGRAIHGHLDPRLGRRRQQVRESTMEMEVAICKRNDKCTWFSGTATCNYLCMGSDHVLNKNCCGRLIVTAVNSCTWETTHCTFTKLKDFWA